MASDVDALELAVLFRGFKHYFGTGALQVSYADLIKIEEDQRILHVMDLMDDSVLPENLPVEVAIGLFSRFRMDFNESEQLSRKYAPTSKFNGNVTIFKAEEPYLISGFNDPVVLHPNLGWEQLCTSKLEVISVPGDHDSMVFQPHVKVLGEKLRNNLFSTTQN